MLQISEIVRQAEDMFDLLNGHFCEAEPARPTIAVFMDGGRGTFGLCAVLKT